MYISFLEATSTINMSCMMQPAASKAISWQWASVEFKVASLFHQLPSQQKMAGWQTELDQHAVTKFVLIWLIDRFMEIGVPYLKIENQKKRLDE